MYFHSVKLENYKSIGNIDNEIILEPRVTAIIGKNESGKSNIIDGLSQILLSDNMEKAFNKNKINRISTTEVDVKIKYVITLKSTLEEKEKFNIYDDTQIIIDEEHYTIKGGLEKYYYDNVKGLMEDIFEKVMIKKNPFSNQDGHKFRAYVEKISFLSLPEWINLPRIMKALKYIEALYRYRKEDEITNSIDIAIKKCEKIFSLLPTVYRRKTDKNLDDVYRVDDIKNQLASPSSFPNSLLPNLVELIGIDKNVFINACETGNNPTQITYRNMIIEAIDEKVNKRFNNYYSAEQIELKPEFNAGSLCFSVRSNMGNCYTSNERSNGLKWYLYSFIDAKSQRIADRNVLYLFDEPGISLHVNAQKELLTFFNDLADKGNQVLYTTHSPFMLNLQNGGIHRIRAADKDKEGFTHIYKTVYNSQLSPNNQQDTLAPIISAIGMNLSDSFGPAKDKLNVVCEGVSDYIYLKTMSKILEIDYDKINFIPSIGASNCLNICNILHGWNCPYIAVFDFDKEGVEKGGEKMRKESLQEIGKQYIYLKDIDHKSIESKEYSKTPYTIEDMIGRDCLEKYMKTNNISENYISESKSLLAKLFCNSIEDGSFDVDEDCKQRFKEFFNRILEAHPNCIES